ncbi:pheophorbide A oxygenase 1 [Striga asiatica]|uniref:Pheophorbide A oxygenase 1 n=1 Tax=Striga asiatica TaxID=4170 RepID=A0A5A7Q3H2_STRAF|nr:pheophorbide A oxygenase 1 [Striga asiatica]
MTFSGPKRSLHAEAPGNHQRTLRLGAPRGDPKKAPRGPATRRTWATSRPRALDNQQWRYTRSNDSGDDVDCRNNRTVGYVHRSTRDDLDPEECPVASLEPDHHRGGRQSRQRRTLCPTVETPQDPPWPPEAWRSITSEGDEDSLAPAGSSSWPHVRLLQQEAPNGGAPFHGLLGGGSSRRFPAQKERKLVNYPPCVAAPPSNSTTAISGDDREVEDVGAAIETEDSEEISSSKFSWRDHWYPVSLVEDLNPRYPTPFQLLNRDLVLWKEGLMRMGIYSVHTMGGLLMDVGRVLESLRQHQKGPRPVPLSPQGLVQQDSLLWFLKGFSLFGQMRMAGKELKPLIPPYRLPDDFDKPEFSSVTIQRDLYYGYDTLMENVSDPSHIDFAHHKVTGRRDRAKPLPFKMEGSGSWGFAGANDGNPRISAKFVAPCYYINKIEINTKLPIVGDQKWVIWICSFNVPMAPGKTRSIVCSARNFFQFTMPGPKWWQVVPRWHEHWTSNKVYDGDMIVLKGQEKIFLSQTSGDINQEYAKITFTPTQADRFVLAFRNWLRLHGNSQPEWFGSTKQQPLPSTMMSKRQMLDRFEQHTLKCSSCRNAYSSFQTLQKILIGAAVVFCATTGIPPEMQLRTVLGALAILSAGLAYAVNEIQKNFVFVDYVHADID